MTVDNELVGGEPMDDVQVGRQCWTASSMGGDGSTTMHLSVTRFWMTMWLMEKRGTCGEAVHYARYRGRQGTRCIAQLHTPSILKCLLTLTF
jgi:hypothetical protein